MYRSFYDHFELNRVISPFEIRQSTNRLRRFCNLNVLNVLDSRGKIY